MRKVRRTLSALLTAVMLMTLLPSTCLTALAAGIAINEANFPDRNFRDRISYSYDKDKDGYLSDLEISLVTSMDVSARNVNISIGDLTGIGYFKALTGLKCGDEFSYFTKLDLSGNPELRELNCINTNNVNGYSYLQEIDVSKNTKLERLSIYGNSALKSPDLSNNKALKYLNCSRTKALTELDLSNNTALTELYCSQNVLETLDLSHNTALETVNCSEGQLKELNISKLKNLKSLDCSSNRINKLDITPCRKLETLNCSYNPLVELKVVTGEDAVGHAALKSLSCEGANLSELDVSSCKNLTALYCTNNKNLESLLIKGCDTLTSLYCSECSLKNINIKGFKALTDFTCRYNQISWLDLRGCTAMKSLDCTGNRLKYIYVDPCPNLEELRCEDNQLTELEIYMCPELKRLCCGVNKLTELDVSRLKQLKVLYCNACLLTKLDVSNLSELETIYCEGNRLKKLETKGCPKLKVIKCRENNFTSLDLYHRVDFGYYAKDSSEFSGQKSTYRMKKSSNGRCTVNFANIVGPKNTGKVEIYWSYVGWQYDALTGIATWTSDSIPNKITYAYHGDGLPGPNNGYESCNMSVTLTLLYDEDCADYPLKVLDFMNHKPVKDCTIKVGDTQYQTDESGNVKIHKDYENGMSGGITISAPGFETQESSFISLSPYKQNTVYLVSSLGDKGIFLNMNNLLVSKHDIDGPRIHAFGQDIELLHLNIGLDFTELSSRKTFKELREANNVYYDEANQTFKIIIGGDYSYKTATKDEVKEDFENFKDYYNSVNFKKCTDKELQNKYNKIKDRLKEEGKDIVFKCDCKIGGFLEVDCSGDTPKYTDGGIFITSKTSAEMEVPFDAYFYQTFKVGGEWGSQIHISEGKSGVFVVKEFEADLKLTAEYGLGVKLLDKRLASAEIIGKMAPHFMFDFKFPLEEPQMLEDFFKATVELEARIELNFLKVFESKHSIFSTEWEVFPNNEVGQEKKEAKSRSLIDIDESSLKKVDRDYLKTQKCSARANTISEASVYPYAAPKLAKLSNGQIVALWLKDDGTKTDNNRTTLYYSVCENGMWSTPKPVCNSGLGDYDVRVSTDSDTLYLLWQRADETLADDCTIDDVIAHTELVFAKYENGVFTAPVTVTDGGKYAFEYSIAAKNGKVNVAWQENSENDYTLLSGTTSVFSRIYNVVDGKWDEIKTISTEKNIIGIAAGFCDDESVVAYTVGTAEEAELFINSQQITYNDVDDSFVTYQNGKFYWLSDGVVNEYSNGAAISTGVACGDEKYSVLTENGNSQIVSRISDGFKNELAVSYQNGDAYTSPVPLTTMGKYISDYSAVPSNGEILTLMIAKNANGSLEEISYATSDLVCQTQKGRTDIKISKCITFDENKVATGNKVQFSAEVTNVGTQKIDKYELTLKDASDNTIAAKTFDKAILPGETQTAAVEYVIPNNFMQQEFKLIVTAINDEDSANNTAETVVGRPDVKLTDIYMECGVIYAEVINTGFAVAENVNVDLSYFDGSKHLIETVGIGDLNPGANEKIEIKSEFNMLRHYYDLNKYCLTVSTDSQEANYGNNDGEVLERPIAVTGIELSKESCEIAVNSSLELSATVAPFDATDKDVIWVSDNVGVASVDFEGVVTACEAGTATITAITKDGDYTASCKVTVVEELPEEKIIVMKKEQIQAYVGGELLPMTDYGNGNFAMAKSINGTYALPLRCIGEAFDMRVDYLGGGKTKLTNAAGDYVVVLRDSDVIEKYDVNNNLLNSFTADFAAFTDDSGITYVPMRAVSEALGLGVSYVGSGTTGHGSYVAISTDIFLNLKPDYVLAEIENAYALGL